MKELLIWFWLAQSADIASTCVALNKGFVESNQFLPKTCPRIALVKIGISSGVTTLALKSGNSKVAKVGLSIAATTNSIAFGMNLNNLVNRK